MSTARRRGAQTRSNPAKSAERIEFWGREYLSACRQSLERARNFGRNADWFTAYLYLFVAFNNIYCLLASFDGREREKIAAALQEIPAHQLDELDNQQYLTLIRDLNDGLPEQFSAGPDFGVQLPGIIKMKEYFLGYEPPECVAHVDKVSSLLSSTDDKRETLAAVSAELLLAIRNNQFHAVKGPRREADLRTLENAYHLLLPLAEKLYAVAERAHTN